MLSLAVGFEGPLRGTPNAGSTANFAIKALSETSSGFSADHGGDGVPLLQKLSFMQNAEDVSLKTPLCCRTVSTSCGIDSPMIPSLSSSLSTGDCYDDPFRLYSTALDTTWERSKSSSDVSGTPCSFADGDKAEKQITSIGAFQTFVSPTSASTRDGSEGPMRRYRTDCDAAKELQRGRSESFNSSVGFDSAGEPASTDFDDPSTEFGTPMVLSRTNSDVFRSTENLGGQDEAERPAADARAAQPAGSSLREAPEVQAAQPQAPAKVGCLAGCLPWLFGDPRPRGRQPWPSVAALLRPQPPGGSVAYDLDKLECVGHLGDGSFGSVTLVKCRITGQTLALKAVPKAVIAGRGFQGCIISEKQVMQECRSPFVVQLAATFSSALHAYFLMEAVMRGDLYTVYSRCFLYGSEAHARFYTACVLRALEHLHEKRIIYRDIKLENVVLGANGYGKLCDFGLSRILSPEEDFRAYTFCGTTEYIAPEVMFSKQGYSMAADWWSLGVLVYELMMADTPFGDEAPSLVFRNAQRGIKAASLPWEEDWADVVQCLCQLEPSERLPEQEDGIQRFERQAWFCRGGFDWLAFSGRSLQAPPIPIVAGLKNLSSCSASQQSFSSTTLCEDCSSWAEWDSAFEDRHGPLIFKD